MPIARNHASPPMLMDGCNKRTKKGCIPQPRRTLSQECPFAHCFICDKIVTSNPTSNRHVLEPIETDLKKIGIRCAARFLQKVLV